jgi:deazaflavin-dependent oxidoreductase (nitroreductase family)
VERGLGTPRRNIVAGEPVKGRVRLADALMRPWFAHGPHRERGVLTTIGRRSGKPRRHCVRAVRRGDRVYLVSIAGTHSAWVLNARANPEVRLRLRRRDLEGTMRELRDAAERATAKAAYAETVFGGDYVECVIHWRGRPTREKIQRLHEMWFERGVPLVIELRTSSRPAERGNRAHQPSLPG